jgi:hypothetical protein
MKKILPIILVVVIVGVVCFFGGEKYAQSKVAGNFLGKGNFNGQFGGRQNASSTKNFSGGGMVSGEIISMDTDSVTVKLQNGSSKIVFYSNSTEISKMATGTAADLKVGQTIMTSGTSNSDGSVSAKTIQIRPAFQSPQP